MASADWHLKRQLHRLMHQHFGFGAKATQSSYIWLKKMTGKSHVGELNHREIVATIKKIPRTTQVRKDMWEMLDKERNASVE